MTAFQVEIQQLRMAGEGRDLKAAFEEWLARLPASFWGDLLELMKGQAGKVGCQLHTVQARAGNLFGHDRGTAPVKM